MMAICNSILAAVDWLPKARGSMWLLRDFQNQWIFQDFSQKHGDNKMKRLHQYIVFNHHLTNWISASPMVHLLSAHKNACVLLKTCANKIVWVLMFIFVSSDTYAAFSWSNHTTSADVSLTLRGTSTVTFQESLATFPNDLGSPRELEYSKLNQV